MDKPETARMIVFGVAIAFALLIAAVWASDAGAATSLALTGGIVLAGVATLASILPRAYPRDRTDDQRDRMKETTP